MSPGRKDILSGVAPASRRNFNPSSLAIKPRTNHTMRSGDRPRHTSWSIRERIKHKLRIAGCDWTDPEDFIDQPARGAGTPRVAQAGEPMRSIRNRIAGLEKLLPLGTE